MASPGRWYWPVTYYENFYMQFNLSYEVTLLTRQPLTPDLLRRALTHLFRKVPVLRLRFAEKDGKTWFREMESEAINFEVISNPDSDEIHDAILGQRHNLTSGPLWCAKLRPQTCPRGQQDEDEDHASTLFLGFHHGITDGNTNMRILGCLVRTIDQLLANQPVQDHDQIGTFAEARRFQEVVDAALDELRNDNQLRNTVLASIRNQPRTYSLVNNTFNISNDVNVTKNIVEVYDAATTAALIKRCKDEGISVNSAFHALCSVAVVDVLHDAGLVQDSYMIHAEFVVNARQYWRGDSPNNPLGCHLLPLCSEFTPTPKDASKDFWGYAKKLHHSLKQNLHPDNILRVKAADILLSSEPSEVKDSPRPPHACFQMSNMGDVTKLVGPEGDQVRVSQVLRMAGLHLGPNNWSHLVHTYRGRLTHVMCYCTNVVTRELAKKYVGLIRTHMTQAVTQ